MPSVAMSELPDPPKGKVGWPWTDETPALPEAMPDGLYWPKVSIVTPSYNQAQFLEETIRSVILQGYPNLEYIIIDGGSKDGSIEIIRKYSPWLAYWVSEPDQGQCEAINKGFRLATGEVVAWLNSDDQYLPGAIWSAVRHLQEKQAMLVYASARLVTAECDLLGIYPAPRVISLSKLLFIWEGDYTNPPQPSVFFRNIVLEKVGLLDNNLHYALDYDLWLRAIQHFRFYYVDEVWSNYTIHTQSKTGKGWRPFAEESYIVGQRYWRSLGLLHGLWFRLIARRKIFARHYIDDVFESYHRRDWPAVRTALLYALLNNPIWLRNRGVLSIGLQALRRLGS